MAILGHRGLRNSLTDRAKIWHNWLRTSPGPTSQNWFTGAGGAENVTSRVFVLFLVPFTSTEYQAEPGSMHPKTRLGGK